MSHSHDTENLERYSFTIPRPLIDSVDELSKKLNLNRSMAVREALTHWVNHSTQKTEVSGNGVAVISYTYDHHESRVMSELMETQHSFETVISNTSHIHLSHVDCFEITICKGNLEEIKELGDRIRSVKGIHSFNINYAKPHKTDW